MLFKKKEKKKKQHLERFLSLKANGQEIEAINFSLCKNEDDTPRLELRTKDVCEAVHFDHVDFDLRTTVKQVKVGAKFQKAVSEKHFKLYIFDVESFEQFYI